MYIKQLEDAMEKRLTPYVADFGTIAQKLVAAYGARNVNVQFLDMPTAATDGKNIFLPALKEVDWRSTALLRGFLLHEIGHIRHSDLPPDTYALLSHIGARGLANALEDVRQENLLIKQHAGARRILDDVGILVLGREVHDMDDPDGTPGEGARFFKNWVLIYSRCKHRSMSFLSRQSIALTGMLESIYGVKLVRQAKKLIDDQLPKAQSYSDVAELAIDLVALKPDDNADDDDADVTDDSEETGSQSDAPAQSDESTSEQSSDSASQDEGGSDDSEEGSACGQDEGNADSSDEADPESNDSPSGDSEDPGSQDDDGSDGDTNGNRVPPDEVGAESSDDAAPESGAGRSNQPHLSDELLAEDSDTDCCLGEIIAGELIEISKDVGINDVPDVVCVLQDVEVEENQTPYPPPDILKAEMKRGEKLGLKLNSILKGMDLERVKPAYGGARINNRRLAMHQTDSRVFLANELVEAKSVEVGVLIDLSGSMLGVITQLKCALCSLCQALSLVSCKYWVDGFHGNSIISVTEGNEKPEQVLERVAALMAAYSTPTGQAVEHASEKLSFSMADQKHLIILTDGEPNSLDRARKALTEASAAGIKVSIIGYGPDPDWVDAFLEDLTENIDVSAKTITCISEFEDIAFSVVREAVIGSRRPAA
jgi:cobaltochelatase CobT